MKIDIRELDVEEKTINNSEEVASEFKENSYDDGRGVVDFDVTDLLYTSAGCVNNSTYFKKNSNIQVNHVDEVIKDVDNRELR